MVRRFLIPFLLSCAVANIGAAAEENWRPLLNEKLTGWEVWLGRPHASIQGLPADLPTDEKGKKLPLGLANDPKGVFTVKIATAGPVITASAMVGVAGQPLSGSINITSPGATSLSVSITGVPLGMGFVVSGSTIVANWPKPVAGSYQLVVTAKDSAGLSAQLKVPVTINPR